VTVIAALGLDGVCAPLAFPGATDAAAFQTYVEQVLVPVLREGDVVVFDNVKPHLAPSVREAIERAGASVFLLPPYSPDFSPIEEMFSKFKGFLRRIGARAKDELLRSGWGRFTDGHSPGHPWLVSTHSTVCKRSVNRCKPEDSDVPMQTVELGNGSLVAFDGEPEDAERVARQFEGRVVTPEPEDEGDDDPWADDDDFEVPDMTPELIAKMFANIAANGG
jgi:transposase